MLFCCLTNDILLYINFYYTKYLIIYFVGFCKFKKCLIADVKIQIIDKDTNIKYSLLYLT